jgi:hypothetical protein
LVEVTMQLLKQRIAIIAMPRNVVVCSAAEHGSESARRLEVKVLASENFRDVLETAEVHTPVLPINCSIGASNEGPRFTTALSPRVILLELFQRTAESFEVVEEVAGGDYGQLQGRGGGLGPKGGGATPAH